MFQYHLILWDNVVTALNVITTIQLELSYCSWKSSIGGSKRMGRLFPRCEDALQEKGDTL